ncbi:MAG: 16S rRNA (cytidine(1402)-2'-O)-methyltransferase [Xanthomonadales bacterium]|nr:16S rRNA (cytidine(1402)-2'-O)-methyltransferase [Xanthomonadales bacterium]NIX13261.1 16S rRNA (cytidine(1402)-2'-O)-methyltransferase [Xanthomonadales bacterium]
MSQTGLYVVATPIGNLEDISPRALRVLSEADVIAAEDTRHTRVLLERYAITSTMLALHEHNEERVVPALLDRLRSGESVALVSDAGTPLLSDPGYRLVRAAGDAGLPVFAVPGPSALTAALSVAGVPSDRFVFEGFLPARTEARRRRLAELQAETRTLVFFESSHRIGKCLADMRKAFGPDRRAVICRELTKRFETVLRGSLEGLTERLEQDAMQSKGEFTVLVEGSESGPSPAGGLELARALLEYLPASQAARVAARITGTPRREIYAAIEKKQGS